MAAQANIGRDERRRLRRFERADLEQRRRRLRETTPAERIDEALRLGDLAQDLRRGMTEARR